MLANALGACDRHETRLWRGRGYHHDAEAVLITFASQPPRTTSRSPVPLSSSSNATGSSVTLCRASSCPSSPLTPQRCRLHRPNASQHSSILFPVWRRHRASRTGVRSLAADLQQVDSQVLSPLLRRLWCPQVKKRMILSPTLKSTALQSSSLRLTAP